MIKKKLDQTENVRNKILYLEKPGPMFSGDNLITKKKCQKCLRLNNGILH